MPRFRLILLLMVCLASSISILMAQEWEFAREKDGIKVYTRHEQQSNLKSFKGEIDIEGDIKTISALIEDVKNFDRWDEDVIEISLLEHAEGKMLKYYVVYNVPWPFKDRDLCVEAVINQDQATGSKQIVARSVPEAVPLNEERERIVEYWQRWTIQPMENGIIHLVVEGFADPAGDIPAWIVNMAITDTPFNMLVSIRGAIESPKIIK
jgi:hypothetical protein